jgi:UDP:flavonoid glycosyltransferase YjiC (YdhE family)
VPFLDEARRHGHETLVVCPPALTGMVDDTGHPWWAGDEPPEAAIRPIREQLPILPAHEASVLANRELFGRLATTAMLPAVGQVVRQWEPDVVLRDPCEYASAVVSLPLGIPTAQVAIGLAEVEWASIAVAAPALEAHQQGLVQDLLQSPYVTRFPASVDASPFPDTRRFREPAATRPEGLPDWWGGSKAPLVYVTFGTVLGHMTIADEVYRAAVHAVAGLDARVLLTVGRRFDPTRLPEVPDHVHVEPWVDQANVLGEADLVVCHGGSGTTFGALAAGVPVVVVPVFADQFANAPRVVEAGAGLAVDTGRDAHGLRHPVGLSDAGTIHRAIETVLMEPSYRHAAGAVATEMEAAPAAGRVLEELLRRH